MGKGREEKYRSGSVEPALEKVGGGDALLEGTTMPQGLIRPESLSGAANGGGRTSGPARVGKGRKDAVLVRRWGG